MTSIEKKLYKSDKKAIIPMWLAALCLNINGKLAAINTLFSDCALIAIVDLEFPFNVILSEKGS